MKKFDNNSMTTGCNAMTVFHGAGKNFHHQTRGLPCLFATVLILAGFAVSAFAQSVPTESAWFHDGQFWVDDENELEAAMDYLLPAGMTKIINFTGSVGVEGNKLYTLNNGETVILKLNGYNFMGNGLIDFRNPGTDSANLVIEGSTMQFNKGIHLNGNLVLTYQGIYTSGGTDYLRFFNPGITVNLTLPNSAWDAFNHNVIIGHDQASEFNMSSGNWAKSANVFIGGDIDPSPMTFGDGTLNIWGKATNWTNTKNLIVGAVGEGVLNLFDGALINTGNFGIGGNGGDGIANIYGAGTILNIFGSHSAAAITADGTAAMNVRDLARVFLRYNDKLDDGVVRPSGILALAEGTSVFDNAYFMVDRGTVQGADNAMTFQNGAMFEGGNYGFVKQATGKFDFDYSHFDSHGSAIDLKSLTFDGAAILSPGYGSKSLWENGKKINFNSQNDLVVLYNLGRAAEPFDENGNIHVDGRGDPLPVGRYGGVAFAGDFNLASGGLAIFDFDPEGDAHHSLTGSGAATRQHKDFVHVDGAAALDGLVHFRPMPGYYRNDVEIEFMTADSFAGTPALSLWPRRWFENWETGNGSLTMTRHTTPFRTSGVSFNEKSVGAALDVIYNEHRAAYQDELMLTQQKDEWFPVLDWMWGMSDADFRRSLRQLSGETRAASFFMPLRSPWRYGFDRVNWRKRDNHVYFGPQNIRKPHPEKRDVWVAPYYDSLSMGNDGNTSGASTSRVSFMAGYDRALSKYSAFGLLFGYSQPKLQQVYSRVLADDYLFGLHYNTRVANDFELKLWGSYGFQEYYLTRNVPIGGGQDVSARYKGNSWTGSIQAAKPYSFHKAGVIRPLAAVDASFVQQKDASENGYYPIALNYGESDWSQVFGRVGLRGDFGWSRFSLTSSLSYSYQFAGDVTPTATHQFQIGGPEFDIRGPNLGRSFVNMGLGSQVYLNRLKSRMLFVQYNGAYGSRTNAQNASLGYQAAF